jgi:hypothetical protein
MNLNLEKTLKEGKTVLSRYARYDITTNSINTIVSMNEHSPHMAALDAFAIGFRQGMKAAQSDTKKGGRHYDK